MLYGFASEYGARTWRTHVTEHTVWELVRYEIEKKHHMHNTKRWSRCCLFAMAFETWISKNRKFDMENTIRGDAVVTDSTRMVVFRKPYPTALLRYGAYVPHRFQITTTQNDNEREEEDAMITALCTTNTTAALPQQASHPADYQYKGLRPVPHAKYKCHGCHTMGDHFRHDCPRGNGEDVASAASDDTTIQLDRCPRPHGIPKSMLCKISKVERGQRVMRDESGTLYVLKKKPKLIH